MNNSLLPNAVYIYSPCSRDYHLDMKNPEKAFTKLGPALRWGAGSGRAKDWKNTESDVWTLYEDQPGLEEYEIAIITKVEVDPKDDNAPCDCENFAGRVTAGVLEPGAKGPLRSSYTCTEHLAETMDWAREGTGLEPEYVPFK